MHICRQEYHKHYLISYRIYTIDMIDEWKYKDLNHGFGGGKYGRVGFFI